MSPRRTIVTASCGIVTAALLLACQIPWPNQPGSQDAERQLAYYVMSEFITAENPHYVTWVSPAEEDPGPLPVDNVLGAWKCEGGSCTEVSPDEPAQKLQAETGRLWQYSYYRFAIVSLNPDATRATIRLDQVHGPLAGLGEEIVLVKKAGKWEVESRQGLWIS